MNKIFRIVFNRETGRWVVASEIAKGRKKQGSGGATAAAVLLAGSLGGLMAVSSPSYAAVVVNGNPQEATASCELMTDSGTTTWTVSASAGNCLAPSLAGTASGQGNPGTDAIFYSSGLTNGNEDSLNLGGYLDVWKTATFHAGIDMSMQRITNLANGQGDYDAVNVLQLKGALQGLGGGATINATNGQVYTPSYTLANANAIGGTTGAATDVGSGFAKVDSALGALSTTANKGFNISADGGATSQNIAPGATAKFAAGSNATVARSGDTITYGVVANPTFSGLVTANGGLKVGAAQSIDMGGNKVTNVAAGTAATDAVNKSQLDAVAATAGGAMSFTGNDAVAGVVNRTLGQTLSIKGAASTAGTYSDNNVKTVTDPVTGTINVQMADSPTFGAVTVNAGGTGKITGVTDGTVASGSKDAVNGGQLYTTNQQVAQQGTTTASGLGGGATYNATTGAITAPSYTLANANTIGGTTGAATDVGSGFAKVDTALGKLNTAVTQNTTNIAGNTTAISNITTQLNSGTIGLVQQAAAGENLTVGKDTDGAAVDFAGTAGARKLINVADGTVAAGSKDAVNGGQLYGVSSSVATALGGDSVVNADGSISAPTYTVTNADGTTSQVSGVEGAVTNLDGRVYENTTNIAGNTTAISNITTQLNSGTIGLVQQAAAGENLTVGKDTDGAAVDFADKYGNARKLAKVAAGGEDEDAVNVAQLKKLADAMGGGSTVNADGSITGPTYYVTNADGSQSTVTNVGDAITNIDGRTYANTTAITNLSQQINSGTVGLVQQAAPGAKLTVGKDTDGTEVDFADKDGNARKLGNVADGTVAAGSKDAVNGGQLHGVSQSVADALGGGSTVNADGSISAPTYTVTNADGTTSQVSGVEGVVTNLDGRVYQNTTAIAGNTQAITNLTQQISNGEVGLVKQDAATRTINVAKENDGTSVNFAGTAGDRTLSGVAAGKADNDAVNVSQLKSAGVIDANGQAKSVVAYDSPDKSSVTLGGEGATTPVAIHNVADGVAEHDAVNVAQLNERLTRSNSDVIEQANAYTDNAINDVWQGMDKVAREVIKQDRRINAHGAMSMAEAQMASGAAAAAVGNPNGAWSVGLGYERGYGAISAGYAKPVGKKSQISFGAAFSGDNQSIGVGFAHKL